MSCLDGDHDTVLDAREIDGEPFSDIMAALDDVDAGNSLLLINSFEPVPLYDVFSSRGFEYDTSQVSEDEWCIEITSE